MILFNSAAMERENYHLNCLRSPHELNISRYDTQIKYEDNFLGTSCVFVFVGWDGSDYGSILHKIKCQIIYIKRPFFHVPERIFLDNFLVSK